VLFAGCAPTSPASTETPQPAIEINSFPSTLKIDDIDIEFSGYKREVTYFEQDFEMIICFDPPNEEVWVFEDVVFKINNQEIPNGGTATDFETGRADGFDCANIGYPIDLIPSTGKAELSIGRLRAFVDPGLEDCDHAQKNLDKAKTGIIITCDPAIVGHDAGFVVTKKPTSMSDEDAVLVALDAFTDKIQVNWKFSFLFEKP